MATVLPIGQPAPLSWTHFLGSQPGHEPQNLKIRGLEEIYDLMKTIVTTYDTTYDITITTYGIFSENYHELLEISHNDAAWARTEPTCRKHPKRQLSQHPLTIGRGLLLLHLLQFAATTSETVQQKEMTPL